LPCARALLVRLIGENIELKLRLDPALGLVKMDPGQAQEFLLNLVLNSRDALPDGGNISMETGNCKMQDQSVRAHLFEPFFTTKSGQGNGHWTGDVHDIVSSHGGLIHVQSEVRRGTRINILLPIIHGHSATRTNIFGRSDRSVPFGNGAGRE
jgi:signal transduction histidine kinase